ncbi:MAG: hypothetical protein R3F60_15695 [bacterium]
MRRLLLPLLLAACSKTPVDREAAVRATVTAIEEAVEARDIDAVVEHLTADFRANDERLADVRRLLQLHFLRQGSIHALVRIQSLTFPAQDRAAVQLSVAVAGTPLPEDGLLDGLGADLIDVDLLLARDGEAWKAHQAKWARRPVW